MKSRVHILLLSISMQVFSMQAQQPAFYHLSTAEGLSDNNVSFVARDRNGILWIGTTEGLNSFDGNRITTYYKHQYPELPDNNITRVLIDNENNVWVRTAGHYLTMLDEKRKFHKILVGDSTDKTGVTHIFNNRQYGLIALKGNAHYFLQPGNPLTFVRRKFPFEDHLTGTAHFTYFLNNGIAVYHRNNNLVVVDYNKLQLQLLTRYPGISGANFINDDELLLFTMKGDPLIRYSISQKKIVKEYKHITDQHGLPLTGDFRNVTRIDSNRFAFTTYFAGLYIVDIEHSTAVHWSHDPVDPRSIGGNNTLNIRYDSSGYLFVTTQTSGLHFYNLKQKQASTRPYFINGDREIFDGYIQSITINRDSQVWMGAQDRLIKWDRVSGKTDFISLQLPDGTSLGGRETIRDVGLEENGNVWIGTSRYGLFVADKKMKQLAHLRPSSPGSKSSLPGPMVNALFDDGEANWWVGTNRGLCLVNKKDFSVSLFSDHPVLKPLSTVFCSSLWMDEERSIWIGTNQGAWHYNRSQGTLKQYNTRQGIPNNTVYAITKDNLGNTYFATLSGLAVLAKNGTIYNYHRNNGLRNDRCEELLKDEKGYIWIGNLTCIIRHDPVSKTFTVFDEGIGFSHGGFRVRSSHRSSNGEMFWGTDKGIIWFYPEQISQKELPLRPAVNAVQAGNTIFGITGPDQLQFSYKTSSFMIRFASGELSGDKKNQLQYKLTGFDEEWKTPVTTGQAVYSKLPPGEYTFEVKASRDGIHWVHASYPLVLKISKPWWQQLWFHLSAAALVIFCLITLYSYYRRRKKTKQIKNTIAYFANSPYEHSSTDDILWDICRNCISHLGFKDCVIYLPDHERKVLVQRAAFGPKNPVKNEIANPIEIPFGSGIVGDVAFTGKPSLVHDTTRDNRYIVDDEKRYSELTVPIVHEGKVLAIIDSENKKKRFYTREDLLALQTIASLCAAKISRSVAMEAMRKSREELLLLNVKMAETKFLNLRLQMNPHFLFNSLSSIQHLIVSQQTNKAYKYLTVFSNFLRSLLNFAEKNFIPLDEEIKILHMYIELESLRFDGSFSWEIKADESLSQDEVLVPSLMVQPFAENAIWHGLLHKEGEKKLSIRFINNAEEYLNCIVEDNGIGRAEAARIKETNIHSKIRESKGIGIIKERLELLQEKTGKPASVKIEDMYDGTGYPAGTRIEITIPYYNPEER